MQAMRTPIQANQRDIGPGKAIMIGVSAAILCGGVWATITSGTSDALAETRLEKEQERIADNSSVVLLQSKLQEARLAVAEWNIKNSADASAPYSTSDEN